MVVCASKIKIISDTLLSGMQVVGLLAFHWRFDPQVLCHGPERLYPALQFTADTVSI